MLASAQREISLVLKNVGDKHPISYIRSVSRIFMLVPLVARSCIASPSTSDL